MGIAASLGATLWTITAVAVGIALLSYFIFPWERVIDEDEGPAGVDMAALTRVGVTAGFLSMAPAQLGGWLIFARAAASFPGRPPGPLEQPALVVPGEVLLFGGILAAFAGCLLPVWASAWVVARRRLGGRADDG